MKGGAIARRLAAIVVVALAGCRASDGPDVIFRGGPILTVDPADHVVGAIAIRDGAIIALGSEGEVMPLATAHTEIHDLRGNALLPGFVAAHEHPTLTAMFGGVVDVSGFTHENDAAVLDALRVAVAATPRGEWIHAMGIDPILVPDLRMPTRRSLDALAPDHPVVVISQTMHSFWANSKAFDAAGITRDTRDPGRGSFYERDSEGELTGFVAESAAAAPLLNALRSPWRLAQRYDRVLTDLLSAGFTTVASPGYNVPPMLARYAASRRLRPRIRQYFYLAMDELKYLPGAPDRSDPFFRILGVKLWHDGSPYTGSMYLTEPYLDTPLARALGIAPASRGEAMIEEGEMVSLLERYAAGGWQVVIHSQGDASSRDVLRALAQAPGLPGGAPRRIEHCLLLPTELLPELARLHVSPSFHINHLYYYGDALEDAIVGPTRAAQMLPVKSAFELGLQPTLHADSPMFPAEPFSLIRTAVLRRTRSGRVIGADQAISVAQALRAMTIHGARQLGVGDDVGSLEVGKQADLQVLSADPYRTPPDRLGEIEVLEAYVAGRRQEIDGR